MVGSRLRELALIGVCVMAFVSAESIAGPPAWAAPGDGSAFGVTVDVTLTGLPAVAVGPLAASNTAGPASATVASATIPGILTTGIITSSAVETPATGAVSATASTANVGVPLLSALGTVSAQAIDATCDATASGINGSTTLTNADLGSLGALAVNPAPNTVIPIDIATVNVATLTLNEQIPNGDGSLTVNAWHLHLLGGGLGALGTGDVVISSATCGPAAPPAVAPTTTTSALSASTVVLGQSVTNTATVSTSVGQPTGTVSFTLCGPLTSASGCTSSGTALGSPVTLPTTTTGSAAATSAPVTPLVPGIYCIGAFYGGDATHGASSDTTACFTAVLVPTTTTSALSDPTVVLGQPVTNTPTVSTSVGQPTGTVSFTLCGPLTSASGCNSSGTALGVPVTLPPTTTGSGAATSAPVTPLVPGIYCIGAFYGGDAAHSASSDTTACFRASTVDVATPTPGSGTAAPGAGSADPGPSPTGHAGALPLTGFDVVTPLVWSGLLDAAGLAALGAARLRRRRT